MFSLKKKREGRINPRWRIDRFLAVYDQDKSVFLGRVQDLSISGMSVLSGEIVPLNHHIKLALEVIVDGGSVNTMHLRCRSLWAREEGETGLYRIGFEFSGVAPASIGAIERIISESNLASAGDPPRDPLTGH